MTKSASEEKTDQRNERCIKRHEAGKLRQKQATVRTPENAGPATSQAVNGKTIQQQVDSNKK